MQLELLNARLNMVGHRYLPYGTFALFYVAVLGCVGTLRFNEKVFPCAPIKALYFVAGLFEFGPAFMGFSILRAAEGMASESLSTHSFFQRKYSSSLGKNGRSGRLLVHHKGIFRTKPVALKIWICIPAECGMAFGFVGCILENVLKEITVIDANRQSAL